MATHFEPFLNSIPGIQQAYTIPWWTLLEAAAAEAGAHGQPQRPPCSFRQNQRCGRRQASNEPQPCSSRQAAAEGARQEKPAFNCQEFLANAAAIAQTLLEDFTPSRNEEKPTATNANKPGDALTTKHSAEEFEITVDVSEFAAEDLTVKTVDNSIVIEAKHGDRADAHGFIARSFVRTIVIPEGVKVENVTCKLATNGILVIAAPIKPQTNERSIPITLTEQPAFPNNSSGTSAATTEEKVELKETVEAEVEVPMSTEDSTLKLD